MINVSWGGGLDLSKANAAVRAGAQAGLRVGLELVLAESNKKVPHEDGDLERSGRVHPPTGDSLSGAISYNTPYARRQHEDKSLRHDKGRTAKFLENALNANQGKVLKIMATEMERRMRG